MGAKLIVGGFEAFGANAVNPTAVAIETLSRDTSFGSRVAWMVLPVTYSGAAMQVVSRLLREEADACLLFGLAERDHEMRIERVAHNEMHGDLADNAGVVHSGIEIARSVESSASVGVRGDVGLIHDALVKAGAPVRYSDDAGRFVCNATLYKVLTGTRASTVMFVHVPPTDLIGGAVSQSMLLEWMRAAIAATLAQTRDDQ